MAQIALDPRGGEAPLLVCRVLDDDLERIERLARLAGYASRSELIRRVVRRGLAELEQEAARTALGPVAPDEATGPDSDRRNNPPGQRQMEGPDSPS